MSRSKHTDPKAIRALRRTRSPRDKRSMGDLSLRRRIGLQRKAAGIFSAEPPPDKNGRSALRIVIQPPRHGFHHPVGKRDLLEVLNSIGPIARYGLRSIELARASAGAASSSLAFGRYCAPGRIILFEQPFPPWRIPGLSRGTILRQFQRAGAIVTSLRAVRATLIDWPGDTLRQFMLREIFLHELGHHVLQHYKGKRSVRIARSRDHESSANRFAEKYGRSTRMGVLPIRRGQG
jgi:hypothetical protein